MKVCIYCLKLPSLGETIIGWLGCIVCQREVDNAMEQFVRERFGVRRNYIRGN